MRKSSKFFIILLLFILLNISVFKVYWIPSQSMEETVMAGDFIYVYKLPYILNYGQPDYGDILLFESPIDPKLDYLKRLVAKPNDTVYIKDSQLYLNGEKYFESYLTEDVFMEDFSPLTLLEDQYFFMGDKREKSQDSRDWGPVSYKKIKGKMLFTLWSSAKDGGK